MPKKHLIFKTYAFKKAKILSALLQIFWYNWVSDIINFYT